MFGKKKKSRGLEAISENNVELDEEALEQAAPRNKYYASVARRYTFAKYVTLILLMCFLFVSLMANRDNITYENLLLLIKDVNLAAQTANKSYETITYSEDSEQTVLKYKNNVVVAGASGVKIFSGTGKQVYGGKEKFAKPFAVSSDKYLLVYDFGGTKFSLYNTFASVYSDSFEYGITDAAISDSGTFALVTKTKEYNYSVVVYSKNCNLINRYRGHEYVIDVAISDDGHRMAIAKIDAEGGYYTAKLLICEPGTDKVTAELTLNDVFPVKCAFSDKGDIALICDSEIFFYDKNGSLKANYPIAGDLSAAACEGNYVAISVSENAIRSDNTVTVLDFEGDVKCEKKIDGRISDIELFSEDLFVLDDSTVHRISISDGKDRKEQVYGYGKTLIVFTQDDVMLCSGVKAEHVDFRK